jgi:uncharacterized protein
MPKRRRRGRKWVGYLLSFLLGGLLVLGGYFWFFPEKPSLREPVDEKTFAQKIFIVDRVISSRLYELGLSGKNVLRQQSPAKKEGNIVWKQSLMKIQCPRSSSLSAIEKNFRKSIATLGKGFSIQSAQTSGSLQLDINIFDRTTHELTFIPTPLPAPRVDLPPSELPPPHKDLSPRVAIVIDDLGGEDTVSQELLHWSYPITFSILPFTPHAKNLASEARKKGKEVILHLPMEPYGYPETKPGKGALLDTMDREALRRQLIEDIEAVPDIQGVSNHMGSRLMEEPEKVKVILSELKKRDLFFLDSRTTSQTVGLETARSLGMKAGERSVFLDHTLGEEAVKQSLERLTQLSLSTGKAIAIGHPHASTIKALKEMLPRIQAKGIEVVPLSTLLE